MSKMTERQLVLYSSCLDNKTIFSFRHNFLPIGSNPIFYGNLFYCRDGEESFFLLLQLYVERVERKIKTDKQRDRERERERGWKRERERGGGEESKLERSRERERRRKGGRLEVRERKIYVDIVMNAHVLCNPGVLLSFNTHATFRPKLFVIHVVFLARSIIPCENIFLALRCAILLRRRERERERGNSNHAEDGG